ncbi:MAG: hypothetical protein ABSG84_19315 [Acidobacteriaceae bacterium]|jgi:hypothetical protein
MPCDCELDLERRWVRVRAWGVVTYAEGLAMRKKFLSDPRFSPDFYQIIDGREVTRIALTTVEIADMAKDAVFNPRSRRAMVAPTRDTFDFARTFQLFRGINAGSELIRVFKTVEEAEKWLAE